MVDVSQRTQHAMETAIAGAAEVGRYGRRIVKMIWDPEPTNDRVVNRPVWCLGCSYTHQLNTNNAPESPASSAVAARSTPPTTLSVTTQPTPTTATPDTPPHSSESSFSSYLAYDEPQEDGGWPQAFLDDFETRIWMTYRSAFEPISRSSDPKASSALSFAMRLKTLADQNGFSSDTGWGCMIRSGQSLLANTLSICHLGRGMFLRPPFNALVNPPPPRRRRTNNLDLNFNRTSPRHG